MLKLNLGCGSVTPDGWQNVDYAPGARLATLPGFAAINRRLRLFDVAWQRGLLIHDLRRPFPWASGSVGAVYSSHTFEHLTREEGEHFLQESQRVLEPRGVLRLIVPDLGGIVDRYRCGDLNAERFVEALGVLPEPSHRAWKRRLAPLIGFPHKCMYDRDALLRVLAAHGFDAEPRGAFDSAIDDIERVELAERTVDAVIVEGRKR